MADSPTLNSQQEPRSDRAHVPTTPVLGACGCGSGCSCGCQSGGPCQCGGCG
ncbi:hypothetical protein ABCR94_01820 [Streptomyces sp. 21So2-11]|uniref:hypothetical protein n=1 Tax=Streptomyces sp. 21So2-11 TaxID=3144408 RepID=UPI003219DBBC